MSYVVKAVIGILLAAIGGILALMGFAGLLHAMMTTNIAEFMNMELYLMIGPVLIPIGLYFIIAAAVGSAAVKKN